MSFVLKWLAISLVLTLPFLAAVRMSSPTESLEVVSFAAPLVRVEERALELASSTRRLFTSGQSENPIGDAFYASDPAHLAERDRHLSTRFTAVAGHHHCVDVVAGHPVHYEIRGLSVIGPRAQPVTEAARLVGVEAVLVYRYEADEHRVIPVDGAGDSWKPGPPPGLEGFTLVRQRRQWQTQEGVMQE